MSEIERLAKVLIDSSSLPLHPQVAIHVVRAILTAMRSPTDKTWIDYDSGNQFVWDTSCGYCGGHKFAVQAYIDHILEEPS